jgi:putative addiction module CopG family antidote
MSGRPYDGHSEDDEMCLWPELERFVAETVASGRYLSASEVVRAALRLLEKQEQARPPPDPDPNRAKERSMAEEGRKSGEQKAAEADVDDFSKDLGPFVVAAETTRMAMVFTDAKAVGNPIIFANDSFLKLTGFGRDEVLGQSFNFLMAQGASPDTLKTIESAFAEEPRDGDPEIRYRRKDDSIFWASIFVSPVRNPAGEVVQHFASFMDSSQHKKEEERLRFLLNELNHRTQNTLATVLAIAKQTLAGAADEQIVKVFEGRLLALSKAQSLLGRTSWDRVGLRQVINRILEPFGLHDLQRERITATGDDVRLQPKAALSLAMVFHELATNAAKHGALSNDAGRVNITWQAEATPEGSRMRLLWQESDGPRFAQPNRKGFGSRLIQRGLAQELNGAVHLSYDPKGVTCQISMPLPEGDGWSKNE